MDETRIGVLLPEEARKPLDKTTVLAIARGLLIPKGLGGTKMGGIVQRLAIDACKAHGWS